MGCTGVMGVELARFAWEGDWEKNMLRQSRAENKGCVLERRRRV